MNTNIAEPVTNESENNLIAVPSENNNLNAGRAMTILTFAIFIWGINFPIMKYAFQQVHPMAFNEIRFSLSAIALLIILLVKEGWIKIPGRDWLLIAIQGICQVLLYQLLFINNLSATASGVASILTSTSPLWTAFLAWVFKVEKLSRWLVIGILVAFIGVVMIVIGGSHGALFGKGLTGEILVLFSSGIWACGTLISKGLLERYSALRVTAISMSIGAVPLLCLGSPFAMRQDWSSVQLMAWVAIFFSAIFAVLIGYLAWTYAVQNLGATRSAAFNNLTPVIAFIAAYFLAHEGVASLQIAGSAVVLFAIWLARRK